MKILEFDIETAPALALTWGVWKQTIAPKNVIDMGYTLCFAAKWYGKRGTMFFSKPKDGMEGMIRAAWDLLNEADAVVHYNGERFDVPTLNKEFLKLGLTPPEPYKQIDLIKTVRKEFKMPTGNSLNEVLRFLGMEQKVSHKGMELWWECMQGDEKAWRVMERYNRKDVTIMEKLYVRLLPWIKQHPNYALYTDEGRPVCTNCGSPHVTRQGIARTRVMQYQQYKCKKCGSWMRERMNCTPNHVKHNTLVKVV